MRRSLLAVVLFLFVPGLVLAQPLADRVPDDAEIYVGWNGTDAMGSGYDQSHLKAILDASQLRELLQASIPQLIKSASSPLGPQGEQAIQQVYDVLCVLARHPTAIYFGGLDANQAGGPPFPKFAILCRAGADAATIQQSIQSILNHASGSPLRVWTADDLVIFADCAMPDPGDHALSKNADFQAALAPLGKDPCGVAYANAKEVVATADALIAQMAPPPVQQYWPQVRDALGLAGLKTIAATSEFEGRNWSTQVFVNAPAPRSGVLAWGDTPPLAADLLKVIPSTATMAGAGTCDLNALFTAIDKAVVQFSPDHGEQFHQVLSQVNQMLGFDVQKDFLAALGAQWAYYVDPTAVGDGPLGFVIVNRPRNADKLQDSMDRIENFANAMVVQQLQGKDPKITIEFRNEVIEGTPVHYLATPFLSPARAIKDGSLYIGLYPQVVVSAYTRPADAKSITDNAGFQSTMQALNGPSQVQSFSFVDLPKTAPMSYQELLAMSRLYLGMGDLFGLHSPPMVVPTYAKLVAELEPAASIGWSDDAGYHFKAVEPFPGAMVAGSAQGVGTVGEAPLLVSILLPSLNRAREAANRVKCAANLRAIGEGCMLYANDNHGAFPPDLGTLVSSTDIHPDVFVCPDSGKSVPSGLSPEQEADWVNKNSDYIYLGGKATMQQMTPTTVVCYEADGNHGGDGMNVLFGDGHIEFLKLDEAHRLINDTTGQKP